jgi:trimeric autotransporter adhesin
MEGNMRESGRRPVGRLCCFALVVISAFGFELPAFGNSMPQSGPPTTTIADTVYLADGTPAQGTLIITWPAFVTTSGTAIAAGSTSVTLGTNGALNVSLTPNAGATPAGAYYTVVYQLGPGEVKTEYWVVPVSSSSLTVAQVVTTPGTGVAGQPVSMQYLNTQLAGMVQLAGAQTITGVKTFSAVPNVPSPVNPGDVANKAYVDSSVSNVGSGNFLPLAGGAMTGPITLPANPAAPMQAATKQYVDTGLASSAGLIAGLVPADELGSGTATSGS